ncbi:hypothetical protein BKA61DRAFT_146933 [Leptodontidium sp. MPI-SDFR-AT-0119]|nr:hypothetical protein BKA61DRAFT_146933 [Leptodontidium sp. MPI-SDFR-AT-0119]
MHVFKSRRSFVRSFVLSFSCSLSLCLSFFHYNRPTDLNPRTIQPFPTLRLPPSLPNSSPYIKPPSYSTPLPALPSYPNSIASSQPKKEKKKTKRGLYTHNKTISIAASHSILSHFRHASMFVCFRIPSFESVPSFPLPSGPSFFPFRP